MHSLILDGEMTVLIFSVFLFVLFCCANMLFNHQLLIVLVASSGARCKPFSFHLISMYMM